ncbi:MAG: tetratricopeptide repeat protein [Spirochaetaceae bacterium]|nr:tetratricopeptide repeat protein [Spirochaetaceae bacterium]
MSPVLDFFKRLFGKETPTAPGSLVEELWTADFGDPAKTRFALEATEAYEASLCRHSGGAGALRLDLKKANLFAWTEAPQRRGDFVIEGDFAFPPAGRAGEAAGHAAAGFLFRFADAGNFYAALVSNKGYFRLDALFNGSPRPLVAWTELPAALEGRRLGEFSLAVIARGDRITLLVDGEWVAEVADGELDAGALAFAAQNYGEAEAASCELRSCFVESRPLEVEAWHIRHNSFELPAAAARFRLAGTYAAMGEWLKAAIELKKIEDRRPLGADELFLKAEVALRLELFDEAEAALEACLALEPGRREAAAEKANLLYLRGRFPELRDYAAGLLAATPGDTRLLGLSGHARFNLGDYAGAAADYGAAAAAEPNQPLFRMNEARSLEQAGRKAEAAEAYLAAARGFYEAEADDDLSLALARLLELRPRAPETRAIKAKALFRAGRKDEARKLIDRILEKPCDDSSLHYLSGILHAERGERDKALARYERALELEPACALYAFRRAECLYLLERPEASAAIAAALELAPGDGWIRNLAAMAILKEGAGGEGDDGAGAGLAPERAARARELLGGALASLRGEAEPAINLAELESLEGRPEAALAALEPFGDNARARNQGGNVLAREARLAPPGSPEREALLGRAVREYEAATALDAGRAEYQANLAAAYFELERFADAEDRIRKALDLEPEARTYLLAGNLASIYGDRPRAEAAYRLGLELAPADPALLFSLGRSYLFAGKAAKAEALRDKLAAVDPGRAARLAAEILEATTLPLACAACGRGWRVPRTLPAQSASSVRAMPPDDSPAGACPSCGKVFCIACRKDALVENRFTCPDCGDPLKLSDDRLRWLVREHLRRAKTGES